MTPSTPTTPSLPREVTLARDSSGSLGLSIAGGRGSALGDVPITVASLTSHGPAMLCGEIKVRVDGLVQQLAAAFSRPSSVLQLPAAGGTSHQAQYSDCHWSQHRSLITAWRLSLVTSC